MLRMANLVLLSAVLLSSGCIISKQLHEQRMSSLSHQLNSSQLEAQTLQRQLEQKDAELSAVRTKLKETNLEFVQVARELAETQRRYAGIDKTMAEKLKDVPGVQVNKEGAATAVVSFRLGGIEIDPATRASIKKIAEAIAQSEGEVYVDGHSDNIPVGNPETRKFYVDNLGLSLARAAAVARTLAEFNVNESRIIVRGFGSQMPVASNEDAEGRAKNRRVEIFYIPPKPGEEPVGEPNVEPMPEPAPEPKPEEKPEVKPEPQPQILPEPIPVPAPEKK